MRKVTQKVKNPLLLPLFQTINAFNHQLRISFIISHIITFWGIPPFFDPLRSDTSIRSEWQWDKLKAKGFMILQDKLNWLLTFPTGTLKLFGLFCVINKTGESSVRYLQNL